MGEIPHLKAAVSRLKKKQFEILAVSLDDSRSELVEVIKSMSVPGVHTWESSGWDENPIRTLYNVQNMPTWYLIDAEGIIRARDPFGDELIPAVEAILVKAEEEKKKKKRVPIG